MGNKISVIIPHYPISEELEICLKKCILSLRGVDEFVVVVNDGIGFAKAVNKGLKVATGNYLMVVNNDIEWLGGNLKDLCKENIVTSPKVNGVVQKFWGCFFCIPRNVYEEVGGLDESYEIGYYEDDDYIKRLESSNICMECIETCDLKTLGGTTMKHFNGKEISHKNKEIFEKKWLQSQ